MDLNSQNPFTTLMPFLNEDLKNLDIDSSGKIVKKTNPTGSDPDKEKQIKDQFVKCVQNCQMPSPRAASPPDSMEGIQHEVQNLEQVKQQVVYLKKLSESPLAKELFPDTHAFEDLVNQQKIMQQLFDQNINAALHEFQTYSANVPIGQAEVENIKALESKLRKLDANPADNEIKNKLYTTIRELEKKQKLQNLSDAIRHQFSDIDNEISKLPDHDRELFLHCVLQTSHYRYTNFNNPFSKYDWERINNYLKIFSKTCDDLNQLQDENLKNEFKACLFSFKNFFDDNINELATGWNDKKDMLIQLMEDIHQLKSKKQFNSYMLSDWVKPLIKETRELPVDERRQILLKTLNALKDFEELPKKNAKLSVAQELALMQSDEHLFKFLQDYNFLLQFACSSSDWARVLKQLASKIPTFKDFEQELRKKPVGEIHQLLPFFNDLAATDPKIAERGLSLLTTWFAKAPPPFQEKTFWLLQRRPVEALLDDIEKLSGDFEKCSWKEDKIKEHFKLQPSSFYEEAFNFTENPDFWKNCQKTLEKYPALVPMFEKWADWMLASSTVGKSAWASDVMQSRPQFKALLSKLFAIEKHNPQLFEQIVSTFPYSRSSRLLSILIDFNDYFDPSNLKTLLQLIKSDPSVIPYLQKTFKPSQFPGIIRPFDLDVNDFAPKLSQIDPKSLTFMIREAPVPLKLKDMLKTYEQNPAKMKKIAEVETSTGKDIIWGKGSISAYSEFDLKILDILSTYPTVRDAVAKKGLNNIPWNEIPDEIWKVDPELPLKLLEWLSSLRKEDPNAKSEIFISMRPLLVDAAVNGKNAVVYQLIDLKPGNDITYNAYAAIVGMADQKAGGMAKACVGLLSEPGKNPSPILDFLNKESWLAAFTPLVDQLGKVYSIADKGTVEQRLQQLPARWKSALLSIYGVGFQHPDIIKDLCAFVSRHPQIGLVEKLLKALSMTKWENQSDMIRDFDRFPVQLSQSKDPEQIRAFIRDFDAKFPRQENTLIYLLNLPEQIMILSNFLRERTDLFQRMIEWDRKLGPPAGRVISSLFNEKILSQLDSDPTFANAVKIGGLPYADSTLMHQFGNGYSHLLQALAGRYSINSFFGLELTQNHILRSISNHPSCLNALKGIDLDKVSNPERFANHVLTVASLGQLDSLAKLLAWMNGNDYAKGENLLDLAKAGYIPEAVKIIERYQADPANPINVSLLKLAGSQNAIAIQRVLQNNPAPVDQPMPVVPPSDALAAVSAQSRIESIKKQTINDKEDRNRAVETAYSFAIAEQLVSASGHIHADLIPEMRKLIQSQKDFPLDSDFANYLQTTLTYLENDPEHSHLLASIEMTSENNSPAALMVRRMFDLPQAEPLTHHHAQVAALSAILSRARQSKGVGSCFGTAWAIISQSNNEKLKQSLRDYHSLLKANCLIRKAQGKAQGTYSYPLSILHERMREPVLFENLLLKGREIALSNMGGNAEYTGLIEKNMTYFEENGIYSKWLDNPDIIAIPPPVGTNIILDALREAFNQTAKSVIQYEVQHPVTKNLGWSRLERRDKLEAIDSLEKYIQLHLDMIEGIQRKLETQYPQHKNYFERIFENLKENVKSSDFANEVILGGEINLSNAVSTAWMKDSGGRPEAVIATDLQFETTTMPYGKFYSKNVEGMLSLICKACQTLPAVERNCCEREPDNLHPMTIPGHALCLKPAMLIGKDIEDIKAHLNQSSGIRMSEIPVAERQKWMDDWINTLPISVQKPFKAQISSLNWENLTLEECGKAMMDSLFKVFGMKPDFEMLVRMEKQFFNNMPSEIQRKIPEQIVGDLNWDGGNYSNCHLACSRSPLTGELAWYYCSRAGDARKPIWWNIHESEWEIMEPISRKVNGSVSYK